MEYATEALVLQTDVEPVIVPGCAGFAFTVSELVALEPQELFAFTVNVPVPVKLLPNVTVIEEPLELPEMVVPEGLVHV